MSDLSVNRSEEKDLPRKKNDGAREKFWRHAIARQIQSGLTQAKFCEQEHLSLNSLSFWKSVLRKKDREQQSVTFEKEQPADLPAFIPVVVVSVRRNALS
jgi:hypothetical protein